MFKAQLSQSRAWWNVAKSAVADSEQRFCRRRKATSARVATSRVHSGLQKRCYNEVVCGFRQKITIAKHYA
tara:strand:- start:4509 stop:4721 length:213 start_codon:yes stop_codon:yes gene_type:complete